MSTRTRTRASARNAGTRMETAVADYLAEALEDDRIDDQARRIFSGCVSDESGCWIWTRCQKGNGYGRTRYNGRDVVAHRAAYEIIYGTVHSSLDLDHLCRVRSCINPEHLEPVTRSENMRRSPLVGRYKLTNTTCVKGHPFDSDNTYVTREGARACKECKREDSRRRKAARRAAA